MAEENFLQILYFTTFIFEGVTAASNGNNAQENRSNNRTETASHLFETNKLPPPPYVGIEDLSPTLPRTEYSYPPIITASTRSPQVQIINDAAGVLGGYFLGSIVVLLQKLSAKDSYDLVKFATGASNRLRSLQALNVLNGLGKPIENFLIETSELFALAPGDSLTAYVNYGVFALENRNATLRPDTNQIIDLMNLAFNSEDVEAFADIIRDVEEYPNATKDANEIGENFVELFMNKHRLINGTAIQTMLRKSINRTIQLRYQSRRVFSDGKSQIKSPVYKGRNAVRLKISTPPRYAKQKFFLISYKDAGSIARNEHEIKYFNSREELNSMKNRNNLSIYIRNSFKNKYLQQSKADRNRQKLHHK